MEALKQFEKQQYLNLETFRKNGQTVKTPVWFALDGDTLLIWTEADSGKAKRIRRDSKVRVVPSTASGEPIGEWVNATASADDSTEAINYASDKFRKKYRMQFNMFGLLGKARGAKYTTLKISLE
jgi:PPOX class probable F420-dependent enzyme